MSKRILSYRAFNVVYIMAIALVVTILVRGNATHPGLVLGLITIVFGLQLLTRARTYSGNASLIHLIVLVLVVLFTIIVMIAGGEPNKLWLSNWYAFCCIGLLADGALRHKYRSDDF